ncbi:MAG TPA: hypothetical protein VGN32_17985 [Ktedonobacterales bacterium]|nr:hypothetical protein [Ktedonobacterales bacterium]
MPMSPPQPMRHPVSASHPQSPAHPIIPMVFEEREPRHAAWEYHVVVIDPREDEPLAEAPLAALGADGWLLASVLRAPAGDASGRLYYYFVRSAF